MAMRPHSTSGAERTFAVITFFDVFARYAESVASAIVKECLGNDLGTPQTYVAAATAAGLLVVAYYKRGGIRGWYERDTDGRECLYYNTAYTVDTQARVLVHERAHSLIAERERDMYPESMPPAVIAGYDDSLYSDEAHRLCRRVERLVVGENR